LGLPGISGAALAASVRAARPGIGIVFASGRNELPTLPGTGRTVLLRKPYDGAAIAAALRSTRPGV
ncbi:MAG: histidine kinase, partial [Chloroflexota bacterium]